MTLTDSALRAVKHADKPQKLFDGNGLFLFVAPRGTKSWRLKYRFQGKVRLRRMNLIKTPALRHPFY
ncbi:MAG: Arm DNA-binding domain-containing protein [Desulfovibrio sp.]|jgi:hypothetical protein|nr:Arm DNA-binding domain-containing protein [Desulfovibrio sp.]